MSESGAAASRQVRERYEVLVSVYEQYRRASGTEWDATVHEELHNAVFDLYGVLRPYLKKANATQELWEDAELWPTGRKWIPAGECPECEHVTDYALVGNGDLCPECGAAVVEACEVPAVDEQGEPVYEWKRGLRTLDELRNRTQTVAYEYEDALGSYEGQRTEKVLLEPLHLARLVNLLQEAMEELDMLDEYEDDLVDDRVEGVSPDE